MTRIIIEAEREGYSPKQIERTMTVGELISLLSDYDEDTPIIFSHDRGYTYGALKEWNISEVNDEEEEDEYE